MVFSWSSTDCTDRSTWAVSLFRDSFCRRLMISKYFCFECSANANKLASASANGLTVGGDALCENVRKCEMRKSHVLRPGPVSQKIRSHERSESINTLPRWTDPTEGVHLCTIAPRRGAMVYPCAYTPRASWTQPTRHISPFGCTVCLISHGSPY